MDRRVNRETETKGGNKEDQLKMFKIVSLWVVTVG